MAALATARSRAATSWRGIGERVRASRSAPDNYTEPNFGDRLIFFRGLAADSRPTERTPIRGGDCHPALQCEKIRVAEFNGRLPHPFQRQRKRLRRELRPRRPV